MPVGETALGLGVTGVLSLENLSDGGAFPEIYMRRGLFRGADFGLRGIDVGTIGYVDTEHQFNPGDCRLLQVLSA